MSSIGPDSRIDRAGLDSQTLEALRVREPATQGASLPAAVAEAVPAYAPPARDPGEETLNADAWRGVAAGERQLPCDSGLERELGQLDLSAAADRGADAVLDSLTA
ncbi:hypothetical protein FE772_24840 [Lysobacter enzymogenes]|nr:hypothetical protein [Lysobacter enzymogenes]QCW28397.1 hypothetical protein FE772_24840 [Lysobacter enzymogenes]